MLAFAVRLATALLTMNYVDQRYETVRVALSLAHGGGFADPFFLPTGPTAHVAPGFPLVLAAVYRVFGDGMAGETAKRVLGCAVSSLSYAFLPAMAGVLKIARPVGIAAGLYGAIIPLNRHEEIAGNWESSWAALFLMALVYLVTQTVLPSAARFGLTGGLTLLFAPALTPIFALFALARRRWLAFPIAALVLLPWAWRNHQQLHSWIWTRDNFGLELSLSNSDGATPTLRDNIRTGYLDTTHPSHSVIEADKICYWGEAAYNRRRLDTAITWITSHPERFALLTLQRIRLFWFPSIYFSMLVALAFWSKRAGPLRAVWLLFPLIYYFIQYDPRYRYPIEWSILLAAANGAAALIHNGKRLYERRRGKTDLAAIS